MTTAKPTMVIGQPTEGRPSRDDTLMACAWVWSHRSTCSRLHVGAVFALEGRILVTGYNGTPAGMPHCDHSCNCRPTAQVRFNEAKGEAPDLIHDDFCLSLKPCESAQHAELNGIAFAAKHGVKLEDSEVYVTHSPCPKCALALISVGVRTVYYNIAYRDLSGVGLLEMAGIDVYQEAFSVGQ